MLTYADYKTPAEFDAGYANSIDDTVVSRWESFFRDRSCRASEYPRMELTYGPDARNQSTSFPRRTRRLVLPSLLPFMEAFGFFSTNG